MQRYLAELHRLNGSVAGHNAHLVLVYLPAYSQIYGGASLYVRDRLKAACEADGLRR